MLVSAVKAYAEKHDPQTAYRIFDEVIERVQTLADFPEIGRQGREHGTREFVVTGTPFIVVYRNLEDGQVEVLHVLHGAQQWPPR